MEAFVIDPGYEYREIVKFIDENNAKLKAILLTHHHTDHSESASLLSSYFGVPVFVNKIEREFYNYDCLNIKSFIPDTCLYFGFFEVFCFHTPGHTKGSSCFLLDNYLFTGDTLFIEGCGLCTGQGADPREMFNSLRKLKNIIEPMVKIYPGHSFGYKVGTSFHELLKNNIYINIPSVDLFVSFRMRSSNKNMPDFQ